MRSGQPTEFPLRPASEWASSCSTEMKKGEKIEAFVGNLKTHSFPHHDPCYVGYFVCFNQQQYYEAHDVLEHLWLTSSGASYQFFKGLIQLAGAFVHLRKQYLRPGHATDGRRLRPACRLFKLALKNLEPYSPRFQDFEVNRAIELCRQSIRQIEESSFSKNPWNPTAPPRLTLG
jgi:predicted metal-dependent hydrolase